MQPKAGDPSGAGLVWPGFSLCYPQAYHQKKTEHTLCFYECNC